MGWAHGALLMPLTFTPDSTGLGGWKEVNQFIKALREGKWMGLDNTRPIYAADAMGSIQELLRRWNKAVFAYRNQFHRCTTLFRRQILLRRHQRRRWQNKQRFIKRRFFGSQPRKPQAAAVASHASIKQYYWTETVGRHLPLTVFLCSRLQKIA